MHPPAFFLLFFCLMQSEFWAHPGAALSSPWLLHTQCGSEMSPCGWCRLRSTGTCMPDFSNWLINLAKYILFQRKIAVLYCRDCTWHPVFLSCVWMYSGSKKKNPCVSEKEVDPDHLCGSTFQICPFFSLGPSVNFPHCKALLNDSSSLLIWHKWLQEIFSLIMKSLSLLCREDLSVWCFCVLLSQGALSSPTTEVIAPSREAVHIAICLFVSHQIPNRFSLKSVKCFSLFSHESYDYQMQTSRWKGCILQLCYLVLFLQCASGFGF